MVYGSSVCISLGGVYIGVFSLFHGCCVLLGIEIGYNFYVSQARRSEKMVSIVLNKKAMLVSDIYYIPLGLMYWGITR